MKQYLLGLSLLLGTVIGVGLFGLPYTTAETGFSIMLIYFLLGGIFVYIINLIYGEISTHAKNNHRLPGYVGLFLGKKAKHFAFITGIVSFAITLLAYILVGGGFLANLLMPLFGGTTEIYIVLFFLAGSFFIFTDSKAIASVEFLLLIIFFAMVGILFFASIPHLQLSYLQTIQPPNGLLPYGIVMFSLWGIDIVPEVKEMVKNKKKTLKSILRFGIFASALTYIIFIISVTGVSGPATSLDAMSGLEPFLSPEILIFGYIFGILTTFTSFITIGVTLKKNFWFDYGLPKHASAFLACAAPLTLFLLGLRNFLSIIEIAGGIFLGINGILIFLIYLKLKQQKKIRKKTALVFISNPVVYMMILVFIFGIGIELYHSLLK